MFLHAFFTPIAIVHARFSSLNALTQKTKKTKQKKNKKTNFSHIRHHPFSFRGKKMYTNGWSMLVGIVKYINPFFSYC